MNLVDKPSVLWHGVVNACGMSSCLAMHAQEDDMSDEGSRNHTNRRSGKSAAASCKKEKVGSKVPEACTVLGEN